jgi:hypothetical protein
VTTLDAEFLRFKQALFAELARYGVPPAEVSKLDREPQLRESFVRSKLPNVQNIRSRLKGRG